MDISERLKGNDGLKLGVHVFFDKGGELAFHLCSRHPLVEQYEGPGEAAYCLPLIHMKSLPDETIPCGAIRNKVAESKVGIIVPIRYHPGDKGPEGIHSHVDHFPSD